MICESRLQKIAHTVKFTKLANMITLKGSFIAQSQKLVITYTRLQVRIVSSYFNDNYEIKRNTTMNVNRSQKHGPIYITSYQSSKIKDHKNNCNYYLLTGCKGRTRKYKPKVFHTTRACEGCLENQGLVFPGTAQASS